jgi:hypothetical protein
MILLAQKKRQHIAATEWRVLSQKPTRWQVNHALADSPVDAALF